MFRISSMWMSFSLLLILAQDPSDKKTWRYQHFESNAQGDKVLVAELSGETSAPIDIKAKGMNVTHLQGTYYTEPREPGEMSQKIRITAEEACYDDLKKLLLLKRDVTVVSEDGAQLQSSELELGLEGKNKKFNTAQDFRLTNANQTITGHGLEADDRLRQLTILEQGHIEVLGKTVLRLDSSGPILVQETSTPSQALVRTSGGTKIQMTDKESADIDSDSAEIMVLRKEKEIEWESILLRGGVVAQLGANRITSDEGTIDQKSGRTEFLGHVVADLLPDPKQKPVHLTAQTLVQQSEQVDGAWKPRFLEATEKVELTFHNEQGEPTLAQCETFRFDLVDQRGAMYGNPWVTATVGTHRIRSAKILLPTPQSLVLQGPKQVQIRQAEQSYTISSRGDIVMARETGSIKMVDTCSIFSKDFRIFADRVDLRMAANGTGLDSVRALDHVEAVQRSDGTRIFGNGMKIVGDRVTIQGRPYAALSRPSMTATMAEIRMDPKSERLEAFRGSERIQIRFTEETKR